VISELEWHPIFSGKKKLQAQSRIDGESKVIEWMFSDNKERGKGARDEKHLNHTDQKKKAENGTQSNYIQPKHKWRK